MSTPSTRYSQVERLFSSPKGQVTYSAYYGMHCDTSDDYIICDAGEIGSR